MFFTTRSSEACMCFYQIMANKTRVYFRVGSPLCILGSRSIRKKRNIHNKPKQKFPSGNFCFFYDKGKSALVFFQRFCPVVFKIHSGNTQYRYALRAFDLAGFGIGTMSEQFVVHLFHHL